MNWIASRIAQSSLNSLPGSARRWPVERAVMPACWWPASCHPEHRWAMACVHQVPGNFGKPIVVSCNVDVKSVTYFHTHLLSLPLSRIRHSTRQGEWRMTGIWLRRAAHSTHAVVIIAANFTSTSTVRPTSHSQCSVYLLNLIGRRAANGILSSCRLKCASESARYRA